VYKSAAGILAAHLRGEGSIKDLVYSQVSKNRHPRMNAIFALASEAAKNEVLLTHLFSLTGLIENEHPLDPNLAKVLASELLWGKGLSNAGNSKPVVTLRGYENKLKLNANSEDICKTRVNSKSKIPRYVRINLLKASNTDRVLSTLKTDGYHEVAYERKSTSYLQFVDMANNLTINNFLIDYHFKDLLAFGAGTTFFDNKLYNEGTLVLQDKASSLAVEALDLPPGAFVLDACAAPGMKTLQAMTKINICGGKNKGRMIAIERDVKRCKTLRSLMQKFGADNIQIHNTDFLDLNPNEFAEVEYILLDPSCSGSGIFHRSGQAEKEDSAERIEKLASFQTKLLRHALSFPSIKRVAYSTCSVHKRENEDVAMEILHGSGNFEPVKSFALKNNCLPEWERRGLSEYGDEANSFIRSKPVDDLGIGFFVAIFERIVSQTNLNQTSKKRKHDKIAGPVAKKLNVS
jgi:putative methyltransferase